MYIVDAIAFNQRFGPLKVITFEELAGQYLHNILMMKPSGCDCIHFAGIRYDFVHTENLKHEERQRRAKFFCRAEVVMADHTDSSRWHTFIENAQNKANLLHFLTTYCSQYHTDIPSRFVLILEGMEKENRRAIHLEKEVVRIVPESVTG